MCKFGNVAVWEQCGCQVQPCDRKRTCTLPPGWVPAPTLLRVRQHDEFCTYLSWCKSWPSESDVVIWGLKMPLELPVYVQSHHQGNQATVPRPQQPPLLALSACPDPPLLLDTPIVLIRPQIALIQDAVATERQADAAVHTAVCYLLQESRIWFSL